ncbi:MAG TPA: ATP-binding protein [Chitinophagaceae bacterium]|nr:ATP-binding protein [Chitinophagaceae bacterium]
MKKIFAVLLFCFVATVATAQLFEVRSLKLRMASTSNDTLRIGMLDSLALAYSEVDLDSSLYYSDQEINLSQKLGYRLSEAFAMSNKGYALFNMGNYPNALRIFLAGLQIAEDKQSEKRLIPANYRSIGGVSASKATPEEYRLQIAGWLHFNTGILYENANNTEKEMFHYSRALSLGEQINHLGLVGIANMNLGRLYLSLGKKDSALACEKKAYDISAKLGFFDYSGSVLLNLGRVYLAMGDKPKAIEYIQKAIVVSNEQQYFRGVIAGKLLMSDIKTKQGEADSGYYFARSALQAAERLGLPDLLLRSYTVMADFYKQMNNNDSIVKYQALIIGIKDSLFNSRQARQFQNIDFDEAQRQLELQAARKDYSNRLQKYALIAGLFVFLLIALILWRNNLNKQKAYYQVKKQKEETDFQKNKVERTLEELKATQAQLIQSEKMASLGELTAGIAHEIQNPLNFVNNFSEVNKELLTEMSDEIDKGNLGEVKAISKSVIDNEEKILHHGKRADAIVKGMLQHSRNNSGQKEPTDLNALADEYLRLAYHGLRAKDKLFSATTKTDFDESIGKVNIIPQDIGRVILNLINNAFYAVDEKTRKMGDSYDPTVSVSTKKINDKVEIRIKDNGNGIPQKVLDKIFQPFFTTKPTGQGTGLGLSLSYDLVKAHGGELKVETKEGEGSEFIIQLPVK